MPTSFPTDVQSQAFQRGGIVVLAPFIVSETGPKKPKPLWNLRKRSTDDTLPVLYRYGSDTLPGFQSQSINSLSISKVYSGIKVVDPIDVVNSFDWTVSLPEARVDVPVLYLKENRLLMNSNISNLANSVFSIFDTGGTVVNSVLNALPGNVKNLLNTNNSTAPNQYLTKTGQSFSPKFQSFNGVTPNSPLVQNSVSISTKASAPSPANAISQSTLQDFLTKLGFNKFTDSALTPYNYLYAVEPTGFEYRLPYLENTLSNLSNNFGEGESNLASGLAGGVRTFGESAAALTNFLKPGTYIEKDKQYSMGDTGKTINVKIPLLNTMSQESINHNWQLLFGLIYQNRPGRVTRAIIDMPVIYELSIPGVAYMPYAFISSLSVNFLGARRLMSLTVPVATSSGDSNTTISTIIPDAYELNISFTGMNEETRNFLYHSITPQGVTTGPLPKI